MEELDSILSSININPFFQIHFTHSAHSAYRNITQNLYQTIKYLETEAVSQSVSHSLTHSLFQFKSSVNENNYTENYETFSSRVSCASEEQGSEKLKSKWIKGERKKSWKWWRAVKNYCLTFWWGKNLYNFIFLFHPRIFFQCNLPWRPKNLELLFFNRYVFYIFFLISQISIIVVRLFSIVIFTLFMIPSKYVHMPKHKTFF